MRVLGEAGDAKKKTEQKIRVCHRTAATAVGVNKRLKKTKAKRHLKRHEFDTKGWCSASTPGLSCTSNVQCARFEACFGTACGSCGKTADCAGGEACLNGRCIASTGRNSIPCSGETGTGDAECQAFSEYLECYVTEPVTDPEIFVCGLGNQCPPSEVINNCDPPQSCLLGDCVTSCSPTNPCGAGTCLGDICVE
jgi:hypothetical protein